MSKKKKYFPGDRKGRLTFVEDLGYLIGNNIRYGRFKCDCGNEIVCPIANVLSQSARRKSCGCYKKEFFKNRKNKKSYENLIHKTEPNCSNYSTHIRNITKNGNSYRVRFSRDGVVLTRDFHSLKDAIDFKRRVIPYLNYTERDKVTGELTFPKLKEAAEIFRNY